MKTEDAHAWALFSIATLGEEGHPSAAQGTASYGWSDSAGIFHGSSGDLLDGVRETVDKRGSTDRVKGIADNGGPDDKKVSPEKIDCWHDQWQQEWLGSLAVTTWPLIIADVATPGLLLLAFQPVE